MRALIALWITRTLGMDKMESRRRENDRMVLEIEAQQQADEPVMDDAPTAHIRKMQRVVKAQLDMRKPISSSMLNSEHAETEEQIVRRWESWRKGRI